MKKHSVIVTGAAGFIGGQTLIRLRDQGFRVIGIDIVSLPDHLRPYADLFLQEDYSSSYVLDMIAHEQPTAIIHCGGSSLVGPSMQDPERYYRNNFEKTKKMLDYLRQHSRSNPRFVFSSSSSVYGETDGQALTELTPARPLSPYGESKHMVETMLRSYARAYGVRFVALRYFNVCGADPEARHGQRPQASHIIARVLESVRDGTSFTLYGQDYDTPDGTCVRDHVHVDDVAQLHVQALSADFVDGIYNVCLGQGTSNHDVIDMARKVTGKIVTVEYSSRRAGDPGILIGDNALLQAQGWQPRFNLKDMVTHAWQWYVR